jgi:hypothetical protein
MTAKGDRLFKSKIHINSIFIAILYITTFAKLQNETSLLHEAAAEQRTADFIIGLTSLTLYADNRNNRRERGERINENVITACRITGVE